MELIRRHYLADERALGDAETLQLNIDSTKPITAIDIKMQATTGAAGGSANPVLTSLSEVVVADGSFNIFAMAGAPMMALQALRGIGRPLNSIERAAGVVGESFARICFGRYYGDKQFYLDPQKYNNLILRVTNALTVAAASYATGTSVLSVIIHTLHEGAEAQQGCMRQWEVARPTLVAAAVSQIDLPTDNPYRELVFCLTDGTVDPDAVAARIRVDANNDEIIIHDARVEDMMQTDIMINQGSLVHNDAFLDMAVGLGTGVVAATEMLHYHHLFGGIKFPLIAPGSNDMFDVRNYRSFRAQVTGGGTGGQCRVLAVQVI